MAKLERELEEDGAGGRASKASKQRCLRSSIAAEEGVLVSVRMRNPETDVEKAAAESVTAQYDKVKEMLAQLKKRS